MILSLDSSHVEKKVNGVTKADNFASKGAVVAIASDVFPCKNPTTLAILATN